MFFKTVTSLIFKAVIYQPARIHFKHQPSIRNVVSRDRGQLIDLEGGGRTIVSFPRRVAIMPNTIKGRKVEEWTESEKIWLNV